MFGEGRKRASRTAELSDKDTGFDLGQPGTMSFDAGKPDGNLEAECDGQGVLAMATPGDRGVSILSCKIL